MNKAQLIGLSAVAAAFVIGVNMFAMNANSGQEEKSNGVANEEPAVAAASSGSAIAYENGGSFDINGKTGADVTVSGLSDEENNLVLEETEYYNGKTISDIQGTDTLVVGDDIYAVSATDSMIKAYENADRTMINDKGEKATEDQLLEYRNNVQTAAEKLTASDFRLYKSVLISLAYTLGGNGLRQTEYEQNNYFAISAKPADADAVSVMKTDIDGLKYKEIIRKFNSADECFNYMGQKLIRAKACRPNDFKSVATILWNKGYFASQTQLEQFYAYLKENGGYEDFPELESLPDDAAEIIREG